MVMDKLMMVEVTLPYSNSHNSYNRNSRIVKDVPVLYFRFYSGLISYHTNFVSRISLRAEGILKSFHKLKNLAHEPLGMTHFIRGTTFCKYKFWLIFPKMLIQRVHLFSQRLEKNVLLVVRHSVSIDCEHRRDSFIDAVQIIKRESLLVDSIVDWVNKQ